MKTPEDILAIPIDCPHQLFSSPESAKDEYIALLRKYHPDVNPSTEAVRVSQHVNVLYHKAEVDIALGRWGTGGTYRFVDISGKQYSTLYFRLDQFDLGTRYLTKNSICYQINEEYADLWHTLREWRDFPTADKAMKDQISHALPSFLNFAKDGNQGVVWISKQESLISLRDVWVYYKEQILPRHVAWIVSRLLGLCCYFEWAGIVHGDINVDNVFLDPQQHTVSLLGGWWYANTLDKKLRALPQRTIDLWGSVDQPKAQLAMDRVCIRALARELLGECTLRTNPDIPAPLLEWMWKPNDTTSAIYALEQWQSDVLFRSFGPRKFVDMPIHAQTIYKFS